MREEDFHLAFRGGLRVGRVDEVLPHHGAEITAYGAGGGGERVGGPGENAHAPDEWLSLENFEKGTHAAAALLAELG